MTHKIQNIILYIITILLLQSCESNQDKLFTTFKDEFQSSITKSNAKKFEYQFDGLSPQTSYFVGCKLKYLHLESSGELTTIEELITFENDSISKIVRRVEVYEGNDNGNEAGRNWNKIETDSISVIDFANDKENWYSNSKLVKACKVKNTTEPYDFIYRIKEGTENDYNCK